MGKMNSLSADLKNIIINTKTGYNDENNAIIDDFFFQMSYNFDIMTTSNRNDDIVNHFGVDALRYYYLHEIPFAQDGNLTNELMIERTNTDLANTLGNLVNRTITMQRKYFPGGVTHRGIINNFDRELVDKCYETRSRVDRFMDTFRVSDAIEEIMNLF